MYGAFYFGRPYLGDFPDGSLHDFSPVGAMGFAQVWFGYVPIITTPIVPVTPAESGGDITWPIRDRSFNTILKNKKYMRQMRLQNL